MPELRSVKWDPRSPAGREEKGRGCTWKPCCLLGVPASCGSGEAVLVASVLLGLMCTFIGRTLCCFSMASGNRAPWVKVADNGVGSGLLHCWLLMYEGVLYELDSPRSTKIDHLDMTRKPTSSCNWGASAQEPIHYESTVLTVLRLWSLRSFGWAYLYYHHSSGGYNCRCLASHSWSWQAQSLISMST